MNSRGKASRLLTSTIIAGLCCGFAAALMAGSSTVLAASAADFRTPEYEKMGSLDYIHAAEAYAKGYSGQGITLGIIDTGVRIIHPDFAGKNPSYSVPYDDEYTLENDCSHGSHVAGIMTANKDDIGMHGVAFNASFAADPIAGEGWYADVSRGYRYLNTVPNLKIVNNSYGFSNPLEFQDLARYGDNSYWEFKYYYENAVLTNDEAWGKANRERIALLAEIVEANDKLYVFSAGNNGFLSSNCLEAGINFYEPRLRNNTISVISCYYPDAEGKTKNNHLSSFSDMAMFNEENTLTAPGSNINSTDGTQLDPAVTAKMSGTSMAAPTVCGVLGLVQEAYPYLTAKQLADVGLSTTSPIGYDRHQSFFTELEGRNPEGKSCFAGISFLCGDDTPRPTTYEGWKELIMKTVNITEFFFPMWCKTENIMDTEGNFIYENMYFYNNVPETIVFGQGLINADKATNGLGSLNAKRLSASDLDRTYAAGTGGQQALYKVDTQGYNSQWSNDITETRVLLPGTGTNQDSDLAARQTFYRQYAQEMENYHGLTGKTADVEAYITKYNEELAANPLLNLHVGLYKEGEGILRLTGNNIYQGANVAAGGLLQIDGSVPGDAYSTGSGILGGVGTIGGNVYNDNLLLPGSYNVQTVYDTDPAFSLGTLHISGNLYGGVNSGGAGSSNSRGLAIAVDAQNQTWSTLSVGGSADLTASKIVPVAGYYPVPGNTYKYLTAASVTGNVRDNQVNSVMTLTGSTAATTASFTAESAGLTKVGGLNGVQDSMLSSLDKISAQAFAADPSSASTHTLLPLYYAEDAVIRKAGTSLAAEDRTRMLQPSPLSRLSANGTRSRLDTFALDGKIQVPYKVPGLAKAEAVSTNLPAALDEKNNLWLQIFRGRQSENYDSSLNNNTFGGMIGYDRSLDLTSRVGGFVSYGKTDYNGDSMNGHSYDWRVGMYGSKVNGDWDYQALLSYGQNRYDLDHDVRLLGKTLNANFKAKVWDADLKARYTLPSTKSKVWQVRPYGQLSYTHTSQDAYTESGSEILAQRMDGAGNNSWRAEAGVEFKRQLAKNGTFTGSLGYKRVLSGADPELNGSFLADKSAGFTLKSSSDKNYLTYSLAIRGSLGGKWTGEVGLMGEYAPHSHSEIVGVTAKYSF